MPPPGRIGRLDVNPDYRRRAGQASSSVRLAIGQRRAHPAAMPDRHRRGALVLAPLASNDRSVFAAAGWQDDIDLRHAEFSGGHTCSGGELLAGRDASCRWSQP
jgi:hypothetical protein